MSSKGFKRAAIDVAIVRIAGIIIAFLLQIYLARVLTVKWFGDYVFAISVVTFMSLPAGLGLSTAAIRFVSAYSRTEENGLLAGFTRRSIQLTSVGIAAACILFSVGVVLIYGNYNQGLSRVLLMSVSLLPMVVGMQMITGICQGLHKAAVSQVVPSIIYPVITAIFIFWYIAYCNEIDAVSAVIVTSAAGFVTIIFGMQYLLRNGRLKFWANNIEYKTKEWVAVGFSALLVSVFTLAVQQTDVLMLGIIKGAKYSGLYFPATRIAMVVIFGINIGQMLFGPIISSKYTVGEIHDLQILVTRSLKYILGYTFVITFLLLLLGKYVLSFYGSEFLDSYPALMVLVISYAVAALTGLGGFFLTLTGRHWKATQLSGICALINVLLNFYLIRSFGIIGAAFSTAITTVILSVLIALDVRKGLGIDPTFLAFFKKEL